MPRLRMGCAILGSLAGLLAAGRAPAAGGTVADQGVALVFPSNHFSGSAPAHFLGTRPGLSDVLKASGWWYRVNGVDTFEHPLPVPTSESYNADSSATLDWSNVDGRGFDFSERLAVFDHEGPSGSYTASVCVKNNNATTLNLTLFHYLDLDVAGSAANDTGLALGPRNLVFEDAGERMRYSTPFEAQAFLVRPVAALDSILNRLNDGDLDEFDGSGLPAAAGDLAVGFQFNRTVAPGAFPCLITGVLASSRVNQPVVKGDYGSPDNTPDIHLQDPATGDVLVWKMRRTQRFATTSPANTPVNHDIAGVDDFYGDYTNVHVRRDRVTGEVFVGNLALAGGATLPLNWKLSATGDFNADGRADILWRNATSQKLALWLMNGHQKVGNLVPSPDQAVASNWEVVGAADFNGDSYRDLLWYNQTSGKIVLWHMDALVQRIAGIFTNPASIGNNNWKAVAVGDFGRGEGGVPDSQDVLWRNDTSGKLVAWHLDLGGNRTSGVFTTPDAPAQPLAYRVVGPR